MNKKDGSNQIYWKVNAVTKFDTRPMSRIDEMLDKVGNAKYLDLAKGYWQVPMVRKWKKKQQPNGSLSVYGDAVWT